MKALFFRAFRTLGAHLRATFQLWSLAEGSELPDDEIARRIRWQAAWLPREHLIRERAKAKRLHRSVKDIDAELKPLVARMIGGAI